MSAQDHSPADAHDPHDPHLAGAHDDHDDHDDPPPAEPESPAWLPLLGGALFLVGLLFFLLTRTTDPEEEAAAAAASASAQAAAAAPAPAAPGAVPSAALRPRRPSPALLKPPVPRDAVEAQDPHAGHNH